MTTSEKCQTGHCFGKWTALTLVVVLALAVVGWATLEQRKNIMKTVEGMEGCSTFVECVNKAGLAGVLEKDGPFTVFVPTDEAFKQVNQEQLTRLLDNKSALTAVLLYHLVPKRVPSEEMANIQDCMTCTVPQTAIPCSEHSYGKSKLIRSAVPCTNGIVYLIDSVQIPPFMASPEGGIEEAELTVVETVTEPAAQNQPAAQPAAQPEAKPETKSEAKSETKADSLEKKIEEHLDRDKAAVERAAEKIETKVHEAEADMRGEVDKVKAELDHGHDAAPATPEKK